MEFKVGDHVKVIDSKSEFFGAIIEVCSIQKNGRYECSGLDCFEWYQLTLCLPEKWAIKTDRQEFWDWATIETGRPYYSNDNKQKPANYYFNYPQDIEGSHTSDIIFEGYIEKDFEYWCRVHRPDLLENTDTVLLRIHSDGKTISGSMITEEFRQAFLSKQIPEKWCVRRTPENAEVLNAWYSSRKPRSLNDFKTTVYISNDLDFYCVPPTDYPEIPYEQWKTIPEVAEWLKLNFYKKDEGLVKKTEIKEERKIVGYTFNPKYLYLISAANIIVGHDCENGFMLMGGGIISLSQLENAGVMHWFEPVYEEEKMTEERFFEKWERDIRLVNPAKWQDVKEKEFRADIKKLLEDAK